MTTTIACIGECMIELMQEEPGRFRQQYGGDSLNTAVYWARALRGYDAEVAYVTALGDDDFSAAMIAAWQDYGLNTAHVQRIANRLPGLYVIEVDQAGERRFHYWRAMAPARELFDHDGAHDLHIALLQFDWLYLTGITAAIMTPNSARKLMETLKTAKDNGSKIAFDSNYRPRLWLDPNAARSAISTILAMSDVALVSFEDEQALYDDADPHATIARLIAAGVSEIVVKQGDRACHVHIDGTTHAVPGETVAHVVDTTAAGDSFNAAYLATRLRGEGAIAAAQAGHRLAAKVVQHKGAIIPDTTG